MPEDTINTGLAGEFYVLAQLAHRGMVGALTLGNTKGVDILVSSPETGHLCRLEVKTSRRGLVRAKLYGDGLFHHWPMSEKHEEMNDPALFFCFVALGEPSERPRFFIAPSAAVSEYVRKQHRLWLDTKQDAVRDNPMRVFRIPSDDPDGLEDNWDLLRGPRVD